MTPRHQLVLISAKKYSIENAETQEQRIMIINRNIMTKNDTKM